MQKPQRLRFDDFDEMTNWGNNSHWQINLEHCRHFHNNNKKKYLFSSQHSHCFILQPPSLTKSFFSDRFQIELPPPLFFTFFPIYVWIHSFFQKNAHEKTSLEAKFSPCSEDWKTDRFINPFSEFFSKFPVLIVNFWKKKKFYPQVRETVIQVFPLPLPAMNQWK